MPLDLRREELAVRELVKIMAKDKNEKVAKCFEICSVSHLPFSVQNTGIILDLPNQEAKPKRIKQEQSLKNRFVQQIKMWSAASLMVNVGGIQVLAEQEHVCFFLMKRGLTSSNLLSKDHQSS